MIQSCMVCGGTSMRYWDTHKGIDVFICEGCGHGVSDMPPGLSDEAGEIYDGEYYAAMSYDRKWRFRVGRAARWMRYLMELRRPPGHSLDIGCSLGYYMAAAQRLGWTPHGTDISQHALQVSRERGMDVFYSRHPDEFPKDLPPLDIVTAAQVVEHFPDPIDYLMALKAKMAPGGLIYIQIPNFMKLIRQGPQAPYVGPPEHVHFFTLDTAHAALEKAGWELVRPPIIRPSTIGWRLWMWIPELIYEMPREIIREPITRNGKLSNMHLFARAV